MLRHLRFLKPALLIIFFSSRSLQSEYIWVESLPKSGTHLISKCITLLTGKQPISYAKERIFEFPDKYFFQSHFCFIRNVEEYSSIKMIFNIRDLRDVVISFYNRSFAPESISSELWQELSDNQKISFLINEDSGIFNVLRQSTNCLTAIKNNPMALIVRFEDLVGPEGGGDLTRQLREIKRIASFLNIELSESRVREVRDSLFGNTETFKKGCIGAWKEMFTTYHKDCFKQALNANLVALGYEVNTQW